MQRKKRIDKFDSKVLAQASNTHFAFSIRSNTIYQVPVQKTATNQIMENANSTEKDAKKIESF